MFYQILYLYLVPLCTSLYVGRKDKKRITYTAFSFYCSTMILNIFSYVFLKKSMFGLLEYNLNYYVIYCIASIFLNCICYDIWKKICTTQISIFMKSTTFFVVLLTNMIVYFLWLLDNSGRMSFELFYLNITNPVNTTASGFYEKMTMLLCLMLLTSISVVLFIYGSKIFMTFKQKNSVYNLKDGKRGRNISFIFLWVCLLISVWLPYYSFHLEDAYAFFYSKGQFIEENYVNPHLVTIKWPQKKRNLVLVFAESFESSYFSKELGGLVDDNLLPNLTELMDEGVFFSERENAFGGATPMPQSMNTISGMASTLSGVNYKTPVGMNSGDIAGTIPGSVNIGDLLKEQGYSMYYMLGTNLIDYEIGAYYKQHGDTKTVGYDDKIESGELPADYKVWWGFEDRKLYNFAKEDLALLGKKQEPFMYTISTGDIHSPSGYTDPICSSPYPDPMQNAIACTDYLMHDFLRWIMKQPFYDNTTVVVVGDHIGHPDKFNDTITPPSQRRVFNLILNSVTPENYDTEKMRKFWAGDMYPTILSAMGAEIEGNRLGLGANLFSNEPTLLEIHGEEFMRKSLEENSEFYFDFLSKVPAN